MMADAVAKIVDLQAEINRDIDLLVDLKCEMVRVIKNVEHAEYQTLLELSLSLLQDLGADCGGYELQHRQCLSHTQKSPLCGEPSGKHTVNSTVFYYCLCVMVKLAK